MHANVSKLDSETVGQFDRKMLEIVGDKALQLEEKEKDKEKAKQKANIIQGVDAALMGGAAGGLARVAADARKGGAGLSSSATAFMGASFKTPQKKAGAGGKGKGKRRKKDEYDADFCDDAHKHFVATRGNQRPGGGGFLPPPPLLPLCSVASVGSVTNYVILTTKPSPWFPYYFSAGALTNNGRGG